MSDHISGPRALATPIADITDFYAFPSPERSGQLVLVLNTLPFARPSDPFSDGLVYRFRLRPVTPAGRSGPAPESPEAQVLRAPLAADPERKRRRSAPAIAGSPYAAEDKESFPCRLEVS